MCLCLLCELALHVRLIWSKCLCWSGAQLSLYPPDEAVGLATLFTFESIYYHRWILYPSELRLLEDSSVT